MKIPKSFQLFGSTYKVTVIAPKDWEGNEDEVGFLFPQLHEVRLKATKQQLLEHTFCHELVHAILLGMGEDTLYSNEKFVDTFAGLLHQALNSGNP